MKSLRLISHSPGETQLFGSYLGELSQKSDVFLLSGQLGAGKTCLVQGIAQGLGVKEYAFSPSFVILREYHGRLPLYHLDFYRLENVEEIADLGLEEYFCGNGICVIEWAEKGFQVLPKENLLVSMRYGPGSPTRRSLLIKAHGPRYEELIQQLGRRDCSAGLNAKC